MSSTVTISSGIQACRSRFFLTSSVVSIENLAHHEHQIEHHGGHGQRIFHSGTLETDSPAISDSEAIALCKHTLAYDKNNHTTNRNALSRLATGSREEGFTLIGAGLKAAAELLLRVSESTSS